MKISRLLGETQKQNPSEANSTNHALLVRAGYVKQVTSGIFSLMPLAKRSIRKIEQIIREEMDKVEGQEVSLPVVMPRELWEESGRYLSIGEEMARFKDRNQRDMLLGMTHEEAAVHLARNTISSYQDLPIMIYQIQTKFRDEARPRGGLIRVREFTMKDAYSFHETNEDLEAYYMRVHEAYERIFKRIGMKNVISVGSDTGMMGGAAAHEFMLVNDCGEDTLVLCPACGYKSNMEIANGVIPARNKGNDAQPLKKVDTGDAHEISEVCRCLGVNESDTVKAVGFAVKGTSDVCLVFLRGDLEVNEAKVRRAIGAAVAPATLGAQHGIVAGNIGAVGLNTSKIAHILYDKSIEGESGMVIGANEEGCHYTGFNTSRDLAGVVFGSYAKVPEGASCTCCGEKLSLARGIEVGNIFQLGTKYSSSMGMTVLGKDGKALTPIMGCYGIGVGRALASVVEESHDDKGLIMPMSIAPYEVYVCVLRPDDSEVAAVSNEIYSELQKLGVEVLLDDREVSNGVKFNDSELLGIPLRVVVSPRAIKAGELELVSRDGSIKERVKIEGAASYIAGLVASLKRFD